MTRHKVRSMTVLVPTRGRPGNVERLRKNLRTTMTTNSWVRFIVDDDDPALDEYLRVTEDVTIGPRLRLGGTLNRYAMDACGTSDIVGFMGDDVLPATQGWDQRILDAMPRNGVVYGNDGVHGPDLPTAAFLDSHIVEVQGFMVPPGMTHLYLDNYWMELGRRLGTLTYLPGVHLEHLHPLVGKGDDDLTYAEANAPEVQSADKELLEQFIEHGDMDEWVRKISA